MVAANYPDPILGFIEEYEGGWSNHSDDPGGATMKGVTQSVFNRFLQTRGEPMRSVRSITDEEHAAIFRDRYWARVRGDDLPSGVDLAVFDAAVNSGPKQAVLWLQRAVGVADDGVIGPVTLGAVAGLPAAETVDSICDQRLAMLRGLRHWPTFRRGWTRRVASVRERGRAMAGASRTTPWQRFMAAALPSFTWRT